MYNKNWFNKHTSCGWEVRPTATSLSMWRVNIVWLLTGLHRNPLWCRHLYLRRDVFVFFLSFLLASFSDSVGTNFTCQDGAHPRFKLTKILFRMATSPGRRDAALLLHYDSHLFTCQCLCNCEQNEGLHFSCLRKRAPAQTQGQQNSQV